MTSWCHGAPGIGFARLGGLTIHDDRKRRADVAAVITSTLQHPPDDIDRLCCGNLGRLNFLRSAAAQLDRPELADVDRLKLTCVLERARANGNYRLGAGKLDGPAAPSLFRGVAGIGYQLLRFLDPQSVPSILIP